jgi:hypothetical protein
MVIYNFTLSLELLLPLGWSHVPPQTAVVANFSICGSLVKWADDCKSINGPCRSLEETTEKSPVPRLQNWE